MSEIAVAPAVAVTGEAVNNDVDLKAKAVSAKLEAFARLLDPFAEGSKFIPINEPGAAEEGSNATESDNGAVSEEKSDGDTKDGTIAEESDSKVATEDPKTDMAETIPEKRNAAATDDGEAPVTKKKRAPAKPKKPTIDKEINGDAPDANVDEEAPMAKQKRTPTKSKKATNDKEVNGDATDANVDEEAPVAKQKRVLTKSKKVTTNNEDNGDVPNAKVNEEAPVAKGKRGAAKSKKPTTDNEDNGDATDPNLPITPPVTPPKKRGRKASTADDANVNASIPKPKASKKAKITESPGDSAEVTTSQESTSTTKTGTPRKRAPVTKDKAVARGLPTSMKECSEADRMLLHMKDVEGKPWADIRATWKAMTGQDTASSTLPNRYNRLKANLMELKEGDAPRLLSATAKIDAEYAEYIAKFHAEKWGKIQKAMEAQGTTDKYPSLFLQKELEKLKSAGTAADGDVDMADGDDGSAAEGANEEDEWVKAED